MDLITIRASSLSELLDCPARWEAKQLLGMRSPTSDAARLGQAVHASTAAFDASNLTGTGITADEAAAAAVDLIHHSDEEVLWDEWTPQTAERTALALHDRYCADIAPRQDYVAVEAQCEALVVSDLGIALTGTTDRVRRTEAGYGIVDLKTGKSAVRADGAVEVGKHALQLGVYELMAAFATQLPMLAPPQIVGLQTGKTDKAQRVAVAEAPSAREVLVGSEEQPGVLSYASRIVHSGLFFGNPRSALCSQKYCPRFPTCPFRA